MHTHLMNILTQTNPQRLSKNVLNRVDSQFVSCLDESESNLKHSKTTPPNTRTRPPKSYIWGVKGTNIVLTLYHTGMVVVYNSIVWTNRVRLPVLLVVS